VFAKLLGDDASRRARGLRSFAFLAMQQGRYAEAATHLADAIPLNRRIGAPVSEIRNRLLLATALDHQGLGARAREHLDSAYALIRRTDAEPTLIFWVGKALARAGDAARAAALLAALERYPHPASATLRSAREGLRGEVLVARGTAKEALPALEQALLADSSGYTLESLAHAAAAAGAADRAASLYESIADDFEFGWEAQEYVRTAAYWLGRAEEQRGEREAAARAYERFLREWSAADPTLVLTADARTRLASLRGQGGR
jgi:tetratricopeptide (TPR) repeat protein